MNTSPYQIIKHYRGNYQVLDADGKDLLGKYVSLHWAQQTVIEHKLQEKALKHLKLLYMAESLTTLTGDDLYQWLYNVLIRCDSRTMRQLMNKPSVLREMKAEWDRKKREAIEKQNSTE